MRITSELLTIRGQVVPEDGDSQIYLPPIVVPTVNTGIALKSLIALGAPNQQDYTFCCARDVLNGPATAQSDTDVAIFGPGQWRVNVLYNLFVDFASAAALMGGNFGATGVYLISPVTLAAFPILNVDRVTNAVNTAQITLLFNFPEKGWKIQFRTPGTAAGQNANTGCAVYAEKLI